MILTKEKKIIYSFYAFCPNCKTSSTTELIKIDYNFKFKKYKITLYSEISIVCAHCLREDRIPEYTAKKIFKRGIKVNDLLALIDNKIIKNPFLVSIASFWWASLLILGLNLLFLIYKFFAVNVIFELPGYSDFTELRGNTLGKVFRLKIKADLTQAFSLDVLEWDRFGYKLLTQEVYFPVFFENENEVFYIFKGDQFYANKVKQIIDELSDFERLSFFDLEVMGVTQSIDVLKNDELKKIFLENYPQIKMKEKPYLVIDSSKVISIEKFIYDNYLYFSISLILAIFCLLLDFYIEKVIFKYKKNLLNQ